MHSLIPCTGHVESVCLKLQCFILLLHSVKPCICACTKQLLHIRSTNALRTLDVLSTLTSPSPFWTEQKQYFFLLSSFSNGLPTESTISYSKSILCQKIHTHFESFGLSLVYLSTPHGFLFTSQRKAFHMPNAFLLAALCFFQCNTDITIKIHFIQCSASKN